MKKLSRTVFFVAILFVFFFMFGGQKIFRSFSEEKKEYQYFALFSEVAALVEAEYVEKIEPGAKFPGAYSAMLAALDRFSAYLDTEKTAVYRLYLQGKTCNSGIYGTKLFNYFYITGIEKNSPAQSAGLKPGDIIKGINGKSIYGLSSWEMVLALLTGKPGKIDIVLLKSRSGKPTKVELHTQPAGKSVIIEKVKNNIHLVHLPRIDGPAVTTLEKQLTGENIKLIIDLRKYNGGDFDSFTRMTRLFFNKTIPLALKLKDKKEEFLLGSNPGKALTYRAVIVVDQSTIMYGELLAYLFRTLDPQPPDNPDNPAAPGKQPAAVTLIGSKTRGFISKLKHIPLEDGSSILLTAGEFLFDGKNPAQTGVEPDIEIKKENTGEIIDRAVSILASNMKKKPGKTHDQDQEKN